MKKLSLLLVIVLLSCQSQKERYDEIKNDFLRMDKDKFFEKAGSIDTILQVLAEKKEIINEFLSDYKKGTLVDTIDMLYKYVFHQINEWDKLKKLLNSISTLSSRNKELNEWCQDLAKIDEVINDYYYSPYPHYVKQVGKHAMKIKKKYWESIKNQFQETISSNLKYDPGFLDNSLKSYIKKKHEFSVIKNIDQLDFDVFFKGPDVLFNRLCKVELGKDRNFLGKIAGFLTGGLIGATGSEGFIKVNTTGIIRFFKDSPYYYTEINNHKVISDEATSNLFN